MSMPPKPCLVSFLLVSSGLLTVSEGGRPSTEAIGIAVEWGIGQAFVAPPGIGCRRRYQTPQHDANTVCRSRSEVEEPLDVQVRYHRRFSPGRIPLLHSALSAVSDGDDPLEDIVHDHEALSTGGEDPEGKTQVPSKDEKGSPRQELNGFSFAPPMTIHKFKTMQERRVPIEIRYTGGVGFKQYYKGASEVLKNRYPDVVVSRDIVEVNSSREQGMFEIYIDGKLAYAKRRDKVGVYLHIEMIDQAVRKARQRRRPGAVVYGDVATYKNGIPASDQDASRGGEGEEGEEG